jgi:hypothetical protein
MATAAAASIAVVCTGRVWVNRFDPSTITHSALTEGRAHTAPRANSGAQLQPRGHTTTASSGTRSTSTIELELELERYELALSYRMARKDIVRSQLDCITRELSQSRNGK